jgi:hypothetical protein
MRATWLEASGRPARPDAQRERQSRGWRFAAWLIVGVIVAPSLLVSSAIGLWHHSGNRFDAAGHALLGAALLVEALSVLGYVVRRRLR